MTIKFELHGKKFKSIPQFENLINACDDCYFNTNKNNDCANAPHNCIDENIIYVEDKDDDQI